MKKELKEKKLIKYIFIVIILFIAVLTISSLKIEKSDSMINEGDGEIRVSIEIKCDALSNDLDKLENESIREYIPKDGIILEKTYYSAKEEETVFDVLNAVCRNNDIQLEFSYSTVFNSYYIEGINYLYEFDGGPQSGWMFSVNDCFPNYGCSSYNLSDGDSIKWLYTCEGLGKDIGLE